MSPLSLIGVAMGKVSTFSYRFGKLSPDARR